MQPRRVIFRVNNLTLTLTHLCCALFIACSSPVVVFFFKEIYENGPFSVGYYDLTLGNFLEERWGGRGFDISCFPSFFLVDFPTLDNTISLHTLEGRRRALWIEFAVQTTITAGNRRRFFFGAFRESDFLFLRFNREEGMSDKYLFGQTTDLRLVR